MIGGYSHNVRARVGVAIIVAVLTLQVQANDAVEQWSVTDIARLFPAPADGWHIGDLQLEQAETFTSDLEMFAGVATGTGASIRLKVSRQYSKESKSFRVTIDTEDIESVARIEAISSGYAHDDALRSELETAGIGVLHVNGHVGITIEADGETGRLIKIGSAGLIMMECMYDRCESDLDIVIGGLDLASIIRFVAFDHRK
tara:strand:- start:41 stop:643 length:603 start_codon:yes stop_codon:yes gene_type:complete